MDVLDESKRKVEAILFTTGRFMDVEEIGKLCGIGSIGHVKDALAALIKNYQDRETSLEIQEDEGSYKLTIKKDFNYLTTSLLDQSELDGPTLKTLSLIAYKQPVLQSDVIDMRGVNAYDHIKILRESQFITTEPKGRSRLIKLAPRFYDYFDLVEGEIAPNLKSERIAVIEEDTKRLEGEVDKIEKTLEEKQQEHKQKKAEGEEEVIETDHEHEEHTTVEDDEGNKS